MILSFLKMSYRNNPRFQNSNVLDSAMYLGRIQINLNGGKKRKYLYFQADFRPKMNDGGG